MGFFSSRAKTHCNRLLYTEAVLASFLVLALEAKLRCQKQNADIGSTIAVQSRREGSENPVFPCAMHHVKNKTNVGNLINWGNRGFPGIYLKLETFIFEMFGGWKIQNNLNVLSWSSLAGGSIPAASHC